MKLQRYELFKPTDGVPILTVYTKPLAELMARTFGLDYAPPNVGWTLGRCLCMDPDCPHCHGHCTQQAVATLYRIDMDDQLGTPFCEDCGCDAFGFGFYAEDEYGVIY